MATYCLNNFVKDPSISDSLMYIYNCSNVLMSMIDPYTTVFYYKGKFVNIVTDGKMNYNNVLDFSSESEAISAVARLDVKKIFIDRINQAIQHDAELGIVPILSATVGAVDLLFFLAVSSTEFHLVNAVFDIKTP